MCSLEKTWGDYAEYLLISEWLPVYFSSLASQASTSNVGCELQVSAHTVSIRFHFLFQYFFLQYGHTLCHVI